MNNWERNYKTKEEAKTAIVEGLMLNHAVAGIDGLLRIHIDGQWFVLKPRKKEKQRYEKEW